MSAQCGRDFLCRLPFIKKKFLCLSRVRNVINSLEVNPAVFSHRRILTFSRIVLLGGWSEKPRRLSLGHSIFNQLHSNCYYCDLFLHRRQPPGLRYWRISRRRRGEPGGGWRWSGLIISDNEATALHWCNANTAALWLWSVWESAEKRSGWGTVVLWSAPHAWDKTHSPLTEHAHPTTHAHNTQACPADGWHRASESSDAQLWHLRAHN